MDMLVKSESLTSVAGAIREKGGTTEQLVFPADFVTAIHAIQSGGVHPQLIVTAPEGSMITAVNGEDTVTGVVGAEGTLTLDLPAFGTWEVMATLDGQEANETIYIEQEYPIELTYATTFAVNGGFNETVTISDGDTELARVQLDAYGCGTIDVNSVRGKTLLFTGLTSGYSTEVSIGTNTEMTVNVFPAGALFWHGRQFEEVTGGWERKAYGGTTSGSITLSDVLTVDSPNIGKTVCAGLINFDSASLQGYTKLIAEGTWTGNGNSPDTNLGVVANYNLGSSGIANKWIVRHQITSNGTHTFQVTLNDITGYPMVSCHNGKNVVRKVWLE